MNVLQKPADVQAHAEDLRRKGRTIAFVPTMGFLHEGHLSLIREGRQRCDDVIVSIFVNPTQFGPDEDLDNYPRNLKKDLTLCREIGVDTVFTPDNATLYGDHYQTYVTLEKLPNHLCGLCRPVHFRGVATIVTKLFNIVKPHVAVFGQKDFQQLAVIRQMTQDLNFNIQIVGSPTVREPDGLAMSSRNAYLKPEQRVSALCLFKSLQMAQEMVRQGEKDARKIVAAAKTLIDSHPETQIDYITICDPDTLEDISEISRPVLMALAVKVGQPRLIDNMILNS
jgi:pantoate--beta-alanine ligase